MSKYKNKNPIDNEALHQKVEALLLEGGVQAVIDSLTGLQRAFVEEYVKDFDAQEAVIRAGYATTSKANAQKLGFNLKGHPAVAVAIKHYSERRTEKAAVDVNYLVQKMIKTINAMEDNIDDPKNAGVLLRAAELLGRHLGMFVERTEITGKDGEAIKYEKVREDADDFTRAIASLAKRAGTRGVAPISNTGTEG